MTQNPIISVKGLSFAYDNVHRTLKDIDIEIAEGSVTVIIGPSGCGKTTLLRCLTGVIPALISGKIAGHITVAGNEILGSSGFVKPAEIAHIIGLVMQEPDHQIVMSTCEDDIAFGPENFAVLPANIRATVDRVLSEVGLAKDTLRNPSELSGGEKQRLAIGGILATYPEVLVFDEPVSSLDTEGKEMFRGYIKRLHESGKTVIIVEHDFAGLDFADNWIGIRRGEVAFSGDPKEILSGHIVEELWR